MSDYTLPEKRWIRSHGRTQGRALTEAQSHALTALLPQRSIRLLNEATTNQISSPFALETSPLLLEIGFGRGEHLLHHMQNNPSFHYIGAEPYIKGIAHLLNDVQKHPDASLLLERLALYPKDIRTLLPHLPKNIIDSVYILFPDPWPKLRHKKRRLIDGQFLDHLAPCMKDHASLWIATDDQDYAISLTQALINHPAFLWNSRSEEDWHIPPPEWIPTYYHCRAIKENRLSYFFHYTKLPSSTKL